MDERQRVVGIGGIFFKARDPAKLRAWYAEHLGIEAAEHGMNFEDGGPVIWAPFPSDTRYFGPSQASLMINYRVPNLDKMLAQLRAAGVTVDSKVEEMEGIGRFGWATDCDGNRFELYEEAKKA